MKQEFLRFLNAGGGIARRNEVQGGHAPGESAVATQKTDTLQIPLFGLLERPENIARFSAGTKSDEQISFLAQAPHLARKDLIGMVIIADGGHEFAVGSEGY